MEVIFVGVYVVGEEYFWFVNFCECFVSDFD